MSRKLLHQKRHRAREIAIQILYSLDIRHEQSAEDALALFPFENEEAEVEMYASMLVRGVSKRQIEVDNIIREYVLSWRPERMVAVDRVALRLAIFEGILQKLIPIPVAISEAVELSKLFGTEESGRFVNGVLGRIVRAMKEGGDQEDDGVSS